MAQNGGKREGAGRPAGSLNKRTSNQILDAKRAVAEARAQGRKLAKEVADDFMTIFANMAMEVRPVTKRELDRGVPRNFIDQAHPNGDEKKFNAITAILHGWVSLLLPFQSARLMGIRMDIADVAEGDVEEVGAMATLERLLDGYAQANEEERRFKAARTVNDVEPEAEDDTPTLVEVRR